MKMYDTTRPVEEYLNVELECDCGLTHYAPVKAVNTGSGAIGSLPGYVRDFGYHRPLILCDKITYEIAGKKCADLLENAGYKTDVLVLKHTGFDEATLGEIVIGTPDDCDLMIGCGTGSINDMLRYASYKLSRPCFTVCTGAPMDGFSASVGIMNVNNLKATMPAHSAEVIIGDTDILAGAPYRMNIAGFDDLIAKLNALNDWRLDVLINDAHYCEKIDTLVTDYVNDIVKKAGKLKARDPEAIGDVFNALLLTGASISLYGNSRPISGAEHHMSHYWEVLGEQRGKPFAMHGEQAAVGTVLALRLAEKLRTMKIDFDSARRQAQSYDAEKWKAEIRRVYGNAADAIISLEESSGKNAPEGQLKRIDVIEQKWKDVLQLLNGLASSEWLRELLKDIGSPCDPKDIGVTPDILKDTYMFCKETRARYTVYQLAWDLGVLDELSDSIIAELQEEDRI